MTLRHLLRSALISEWQNIHENEYADVQISRIINAITDAMAKSAKLFPVMDYGKVEEELLRRIESPSVSGTELRACQFIEERQRMGIAKYRTTVEANPLPLVEWLKHQQAELADALVYATRAIQELEKPATKN